MNQGVVKNEATFSGTHLIARNSVLNFFGQIIPIIVGILSIPFVVLGLGIDKFGILSIASMLLGYFSLFDLGLGRSTTKFIAEEIGKGMTQQLRTLFWTSSTLSFSLGILGGLIVAALAPLLAEAVFRIPPELIDIAKATFLILAISTPLVLLSAALRGVLEAAQRFEYVNGVAVISSSLSFLLPVIGLAVGFGVEGIVVLLMASKLCSTLAYFLLCIRVFPILKQGVSLDFKQVRRVLTYGGWISISNVVHPVLVYLDRLLIGSLISIGAVAYYTTPYEMITKLWILPVSLTMTLFPAFSTLGTVSRRELTVLCSHSVKYLLLLIGPLVMLLILFAENILSLWLGIEFAEKGTDVIRILAIGILFDSMAHIPYALLHGLGRPDIPARFHIFELVLYIPLMWILVSSAGIAGAALACSIRVTVNSFLLFWAAGRFIDLQAFLQTGFKRSITVVVLMACILAMLYMSGGTVLVNTILSLTILGLFGLTSWRYVLDDSERRLLSLTARHFVGQTKRAG
ncbi:MAG: flippase [Ignavibacteriae bacterium]|nr:flippase [Ignavibacteriota bacterium]